MIWISFLASATAYFMRAVLDAIAHSGGHFNTYMRDTSMVRTHTKYVVGLRTSIEHHGGHAFVVHHPYQPLA